MARKFAGTAAAAIENIRLTPKSFPLIHGQIGRVVLSRFPDAVYVREQGDKEWALVGSRIPPIPALNPAHAHRSHF